MKESTAAFEKKYQQLLNKYVELESRADAQLWELRNLRRKEVDRERIIRERVEDETNYLRERIHLILEANREQAKRIKELEKQKSIETHREGAEPNRYDMIQMCKQREWWLGGDVLMDEEETLRYPWIDFRDEFRRIRLEAFFEWIRQKHNEYKNAWQRERYANDPDYRKHILEREKEKRQCRKK